MSTEISEKEWWLIADALRIAEKQHERDDFMALATIVRDLRMRVLDARVYPSTTTI